MSKYVIIGGSAAGISCAEAIRESDKKNGITLISDEKFPLYSRCLLTYLISGKIGKEGLGFKEEDFYKRNGIEALHGGKAVSLNAKTKEVKMSNGKTVKFDKLLIATGASSKRLDIPGAEKRGVFGLRTIGDAEGIISMLDKIETAVILGGGLIGLRDAYALRLRGKNVKVIVKSPQILSQMLDKEAADMIELRLSKEGIEVMKGLAAKEINGGACANGITLDDGASLPCQLVIIGKGVRPNVDIAKEAGIEVDSGIIVDDHLRTSSEDIYAAGDVAEALDISRQEKRINAIWPAAVEQGRAAGRNMAGGKAVYDGSSMMNSLDFFDLTTISIGITKPKGPGFEELISIDKQRSIYKKVVLKNNIMCGLILVNNVRNAGIYGILIRKRADVSSVKNILLNDNFDYAKILPLVKKYPAKFDTEEFKETVISF